MERFVRLILIAVLFQLNANSCQQREWTNPFDPSCPKEIWTPTDFKAVQEGTAVKLTWSQPINQISGFKITRSIDGGTSIGLPDQANGINQLVDNSLIGGKVHSYSLTAFAGNNLSNTVTASITPILTAVITASDVAVFSFNAAILGGSTTSDGGASITQRGVCYSLTRNPTLSNSFISIGSGIGNFNSIVTYLSPGSVYYVRSYATNSQGTAYGTEVSFKTAAPPLQSGTVTDLDGNVYNTVTIGTQVWMAENLKTTKFSDGAAITNITDNNAWTGLTSAAYCWYGNDASSFKNTYGALYNWYAMNSGKLAPVGWHVPTSTEWTTLVNYVGTNVVAAKIKMQFGWDTNLGTNETGFSLLPAGFRASDNSSFQHAGYAYNYWLFSEDPIATGALSGYILTDWASGIFIPGSGTLDDGRKRGNSIRCLKDAIPIISTTAISSITQSSAISGGVISSNGGNAITISGICWSTNPNPTITNSKTTNGTGTGSFTSSISGLSPGTTYYIRAYATNGAGTAYGSQISFTTIANQITPIFTTIGPLCQNSTPPVLPTSSANTPAITGTWNPATISTANSGTTAYMFTPAAGQNAATKSLSVTITPLISPIFTAIGPLNQNSAAPVLPLTSTNGITGTWLPSAISTTTAGTVRYTFTPDAGQCASVLTMDIVTTAFTVTDIDGNVYNTVTIDTQVWMASNLKVTKYNDNTTIPLVTDNTAWTNLSTPGYCWYNNDAVANKNIYGTLYNSFAVNTGKMCPIGWHIASDIEWDKLIKYLGDNNFGYNGISAAISKSMATQTNWNPSSQAGSPGYDPSTNNSSGFSAFPGGIRQNDGVFSNIGEVSWWWCNSITPKFRYISTSNLGITYVTGNSTTKGGYSVRCLKD